MTSLTSDHAGALGPRHPVSHTGPYDTTGDREIMSGREKGKGRDEHTKELKRLYD